jgi:hypothetical protein
METRSFSKAGAKSQVLPGSASANYAVPWRVERLARDRPSHLRNITILKVRDSPSHEIVSAGTFDGNDVCQFDRNALVGVDQRKFNCASGVTIHKSKRRTLLSRDLPSIADLHQRMGQQNGMSPFWR